MKACFFTLIIQPCRFGLCWGRAGSIPPMSEKIRLRFTLFCSSSSLNFLVCSYRDPNRPFFLFFFYKQRFFFNPASVLLNFSMNWASNVFKCCFLRRGIVLPRHAIFCIFFSVATSGSMYVLFMSSVFWL